MKKNPARYVISDGVRYLTGGNNFVRDPALALKFTDRESAEERLDKIRPLVGTLFMVKREFKGGLR